MALEEVVLTIAIELLQHSKSAEDTSMPTDVTADESSEAEALSFN